MPTETSIGDALTRVAETFSRLVVQNLQLLRTEVESEARTVGDRGRLVGRRLLRATPFLIAGVAIASLSIGELLGLLLEPWLGRGSGPLCTLLFGLAEAAIAAAWIRMTVEKGARSGRKSDARRSGLPNATAKPPIAQPRRAAQPVRDPRQLWTYGSHSFPAVSPVTIVEEKTHGSMG